MNWMESLQSLSAMVLLFLLVSGSQYLKYHLRNQMNF